MNGWASPLARWRPPPALTAIATPIGGLLIFVSGHDPEQAYAEIVEGSLAWSNWPNALNLATPLVGMSLAAAMPMRGDMIELGDDGQMVVGGLTAALMPLALPASGLLVTALAPAGAALAAWGETRHRVPILISSLLLSYTAVGVASYLARAARVDQQTVVGYNLRMRGLNARFAGYGGFGLASQASGAMFASATTAGLVGAIVVLGSQYRFIDGALLARSCTGSDPMAALLANGEPVGAILAGLLFPGIDGCGLHDPLAAAIAEDPSPATAERMCVDIELNGARTPGQRVAARRPTAFHQRNAEVCMTVDADRFARRFVEVFPGRKRLNDRRLHACLRLTKASASTRKTTAPLTTCCQ